MTIHTAAAPVLSALGPNCLPRHNGIDLIEIGRRAIHDGPVCDEASLILSDWLGERMADHAREILPARHPWPQVNPDKPVYLMEYVCGALVELGFYSSARLAKQASDVGKWIEIDGGWRSEDGRTLIQP